MSAPDVAEDKSLVNPEQLLRAASSEVIKSDGGTVLVRASSPWHTTSNHVALKQYRSKNLARRLLAMLGAGRAERCWRIGHALLKRGVATAHPLAHARPSLRNRHSYLATEWIADSQNLHHFGWQLAKTKVSRQMRLVRLCAEAVGRQVSRLHTAGVSHRDLTGSNILIVESGQGVEAYLIDLEGARMRRGLRRAVRVKNLARLELSIERQHPVVSRTDRLRFLKTYLGGTLSRTTEWKQLWREIARAKEPLERRYARRDETIY